MHKKLNVRKGDVVMVITGESKGQKGRILGVDRKKERALVEGLNLISKHTKPHSKAPQGGIIRKEAPIHISNLMLIDPASGKPSRTGKRLNKKNKLIRYSKKSGEEIK